MNENEQQIAIAEFCGFVKIGTAPFSNGRQAGRNKRRSGNVSSRLPS
jgi:hypothetical protein